MTGKSRSPLALAAKAVLDISVEREACPMHWPRPPAPSIP
jgi:arabinose 5-phosphate isomerase